jgi:hypothetical protein
MLNNPVMMVDPGGDSTFAMRLDGSLEFLNGNTYYKEENGSYTEVEAGQAYEGTGVATDKVISTKYKDNSTYVRNGVLRRTEASSGKSTFLFKDPSNRSAAESFYYWAADNSDVEWAFARGIENGVFGGALGTNHNAGQTSLVSQFEAQFGKYIDLVSHSHPNNSMGPSYDLKIMGQNKLVGDLNAAATRGSTNYQREVYEVSTGKIYGYSELTLGPARVGSGNYDYYYKKP